MIEEFINHDIKLQEELELYSHPIVYRNNNLFNVEFLLEFTDDINF